MKMIYNKEKVEKNIGRKYVREWAGEGHIDDKQEILKSYFNDAYSSQNMWAWALSFILCIVAGAGVFAFFTSFSHMLWIIPTLVTGVIAFFFVESRIKYHNTYRTGDIEAAILIMIVCVISLPPIILDKDLGSIYFGTVGMILTAVAVHRYRSIPSLLACVAFFVYLTGSITEQIGLITLLPFVLILISFGASVFLEKHYRQAPFLFRETVSIGRGLTLIILILAGNYFVVRSLSEELMNSQGEIRFAWFFYLYSILVPVAMIFLGLKKKRRTELVLGLLGVVAGILGIREYHSVMPIEYALTISGGFMLAVGYVAIVALKVPRAGISLEVTNSSARTSRVSNLVIGVVSSRQSTPSDLTTTDLEGGGHFGGAGAGSKY
jgi:hypothetical protein